MTKIFLLSACLLTQQNHCIGAKLFLSGYVALIASPFLALIRKSMHHDIKTNNQNNKLTQAIDEQPKIKDTYQDIHKGWDNWNATSEKQNKAYNEDLMPKINIILKELLTPDDFFKECFSKCTIKDLETWENPPTKEEWELFCKNEAAK